MCSRPITSLLILSPLFLYAKALTTPSSFVRHERRTCFIATSTAKTTTSNQHNRRSCPKEPTTILFAGADGTNTEKEKAKAALLRTSKHLQKLNKKTAAAAPVVATVDKTQEELDDALLQSYMDQTVNALKEELASRGLTKSGVKSDLALRLMQHDMEQQLAQNLPADNDDITSETSSNEAKAQAEESEELQEERQNIYQSYIVQPSNSLKVLLKSKRLKKTGRKPDLAKRLTDYDMELKYPHLRDTQTDFKDDVETDPKKVREDEIARAKRREEMEAREPFIEFAGIEGLSYAAGKALAMAGFEAPSAIQSAVIPMASMGESVIMHAETGSGKTLAYLLPITEQLWKDERLDNTNSKFGIILTPTRELAAQVAGVASVLSPLNSVKLITTPTNLLSKNNAEDGIDGGKVEKGGGNVRLIVGSAKAIMVSLYGDGKMPAPPTPKPLAKYFLSNVGWMVMDEVDRLLDVKKGRTTKKKKHEKPAAIVAAAVARLTLGNFQIIAASATVGRPLRRELARVLGLPSKECPQVVREDESTTSSSTANDDKHIGRAVTIPMGVNNFVFPCDGGTSGSLLTSAAFVAKALPPKKDGTPRRALLVLSKGSGLTVHNTVGALGHFGVTPKPVALLDALEVDGTPDRLIAVHREVSGSSFGVDASESNEGYVLVTSEDNIRGLHLDGLDTVIVVGRPEGPDEYSHVAGRTGRAGQEGNVINVVSFEQAAALTSWEKMLMVDFVPLEMSQISKLN